MLDSRYRIETSVNRVQNHKGCYQDARLRYPVLVVRIDSSSDFQSVRRLADRL